MRLLGGMRALMLLNSHLSRVFLVRLCKEVQTERIKKTEPLNRNPHFKNVFQLLCYLFFFSSFFSVTCISVVAWIFL